ncbi:M20/M25/M40 family metallo-hydrolase [Actinoplanes sp. NEAU-A12]|uniref:M20/M25/M40 family metallo-hydrolase n=1 Tax=Actinoplanes sandaracinus TaxID=3045177 RepID=A0ABT6WTD0_9ACTN|nr:M20/M25/M40 family metallo-hydrolase [Actinoplanes sandaracinus]MDI6102988.1 M20/M25/M40 family metallo-hydrolase [Actinoplanes sandaracinus]
MGRLDQDAAIALLREMVQIPSVSGAEGQLVGRLAALTRDWGLRSRIDEVGNLHVEAGAADGPELMLLGHIDTVPGDLPVRLEGNRLHGRGTVDAKGPLATMLCAARRLADRIPARIVVVGAVDEERTSVGARHLMNRPAPDAVVIGEPSGADGVGIGYMGIVRFALDVVRPAAHTSSKQRTAAEVAIDRWPELRERLAAGYDLEGPLSERPLPSVVAVRGDLEQSRLEVSCRVPIGFDAEAFAAELRQWADGDRLTVIEQVPAVRAARTSPVAGALHAAIRARGGRPRHRLKLGTSDWNVVGPRWGVPIAAYGPGDSQLCHTSAEHISLPEYLTAIDTLTDALERLANSMRPLLATAGGVREGNGGNGS